MLEFISCVNIFLLPIEIKMKSVKETKLFLKRLESGIHNNLINNSDPMIKNFEDRGVNYNHKKPNEAPLTLKINGYEKINGLEQYIKV